MAVKHDPDCVFCTLPAERIRGENVHVIYIRDTAPVSPGHTLIIPRRHIASVFDATAGEWLEFLVLMDLARQEIDEEFQPDGYTIGIDDGQAAGQSVPHLQLHLIPRYAGDSQPVGVRDALICAAKPEWKDFFALTTAVPDDAIGDRDDPPPQKRRLLWPDA